MKSKENWANEVLGSLEGMSPAAPSPDLFLKIEREIKGVNANVIPLRTLRWVAVAASIVIGLNVYVFLSEVNSEKERTSSNYSEVQLINEYQLYN